MLGQERINEMEVYSATDCTDSKASHMIATLIAIQRELLLQLKAIERERDDLRNEIKQVKFEAEAVDIGARAVMVLYGGMATGYDEQRRRAEALECDLLDLRAGNYQGGKMLNRLMPMVKLLRRVGYFAAMALRLGRPLDGRVIACQTCGRWDVLRSFDFGGWRVNVLDLKRSQCGKCFTASAVSIGDLTTEPGYSIAIGGPIDIGPRTGGIEIKSGE